MPLLHFKPVDITVEVDEDTKVLVAATRNGVPIRFGCGACRCGTCAVKVEGDGKLSEMKPNEHALLAKMKLSTSGEIRLSCQARIESGRAEIDLNFQDTYDPDTGYDDY